MPYHLITFTNQNRRGSERCPYCGGYHYSDAQFDACAREHSYRDRTYRCERCGRTHLTLAEADRCCEVEKRFEIKYGSENTNQSLDSVKDSGSTDHSGGILGSFFNAGGNKGSSNGPGWFG